MSEIQVGDKVKWLRLYHADWEIIYYGTVVEIEVGAEIPCAIVQPKGRYEREQRVECDTLLRAEDKAKPRPNRVDELRRKDGWLSKLPRLLWLGEKRGGYIWYSKLQP